MTSTTAAAGVTRRKKTTFRDVHNRSASPWIATLAWLGGLVIIFPAAWMVLTAFKPEGEAVTKTPHVIFTPTLAEFRAVLHSGFGAYFLNSAAATIGSTIIVLVLAVPAAYALAVRPIPKASDVLFFFLSTRMLPVVGAIVPIYLIYKNLHLLDNVWGLIILYAAMNLPLAVWMLRSFMIEIPKEIFEAARVDGANAWVELTRVLIPMVAPGLAATSLLCVIFSWNEFFLAVNLTSTRAATVPMYLIGFISSKGLFWAKLSAASTLAALPVVIAGWVAQKQLVRGLSLGAVK